MDRLDDSQTPKRFIQSPDDPLNNPDDWLFTSPSAPSSPSNTGGVTSDHVVIVAASSEHTEATMFQPSFLVLPVVTTDPAQTIKFQFLPELMEDIEENWTNEQAVVNDNTFKWVDFNTDYVKKVQISFSGSGSYETRHYTSGSLTISVKETETR